MLKSIFIAGAVLTATTGYSLTISPSAVHDATTFGIGFPPFAQQAFSGGAGSFTANGVTVGSVLTIDSSSVKLDGTISISADGSSGNTRFFGQFTLSEASYVTGFGTASGDSVDPFASTTVSVTIGSITEEQIQTGNIPTYLDLSSALVSLGNGDIATPQLLSAGSYLFDILIEAEDASLLGNVAFSATGSAGFSVVSAPDGGATVALLGLGFLGLAGLRRNIRP